MYNLDMKSDAMSEAIGEFLIENNTDGFELSSFIECLEEVLISTYPNGKRA